MGRTWAEGVAAHSAKYPQHAELIQAYDDRWIETLRGDIPGTVRLQGDEFSVGNLDQPGGISPVLTGSFVAPAHVGDTASVTVPFAVSGLLLPAEQRPPFQLTGGGDVTFTLEWQAYLGGWAITFSSFDFGAGGRPD